MHRIDGAGHVNNRFVSEDPAANRPPTEITPEIMNAFQEELAAFIEWAGIVLAKGDNTQLKQALVTKFAAIDSPTFTGNPKAPKPAQFDSDTSLATTEFLRGEGIQASGVSSVSTTPFAVTNAHAGGFLYASTGAGVINLPDVTTWPPGKALIIQAAVPTTINRNGAQLIYTNGTGQSSVTINNGESVKLFAVPAFSGWTARVNCGAKYLSSGAIATTTTLDSSHVGKLIAVTGSSSFTVTLPARSAVQDGKFIDFHSTANTSSTVTILRAGADNLYVSGTPVTTIDLGPGDTLRVVSSDAYGGWAVSGGSAQLKYAAAFSSSLATNGYQRLPSGLIVQVAQVSKSTSANVAVTWPIAFPNACLNAIPGWAGDVAATDGVSMFNPTTTGATLRSPFGAAGAAVAVWAFGW